MNISIQKHPLLTRNSAASVCLARKSVSSLLALLFTAAAGGGFASSAAAVTHVVPEEGRIVEVYDDGRAVTLVSVLDEYLDLATAVIRDGQQPEEAPVPLGPELVVGQGDHPENHTFVRILDRYGMPAIQFLAYPEQVRGGVHVAFGRDGAGEGVIAAAPIADDRTTEIRFFNRKGGKTGTLQPEGLSPPYVIAIANILRSRTSDELIVASRSQTDERGEVQLYTLDGRLIGRATFYSPGEGTVALTTRRSATEPAFGLYYQQQGTLVEFVDGTANVRQLESADGRRLVNPSVFSDDEWWITGPGDLLSEVDILDSEDQVRRLDVGVLENQFWISGKEWKPEDWREEEASHIFFSRYGHIRTDGGTEAYGNPHVLLEDWDNRDRILDEAVEGWRETGHFRPLNEQSRNLWEPCFTHRHVGLWEPWSRIIDEDSGMPRFMAISRLDNVATYEEFENPFFVGTYAWNLPELDWFYVQPLRRFLREFAPVFRAHPEYVISLEPNHEHEISTGKDDTVGDYNPAMIALFRDYIVRMHGDDIERINAIMGTEFAEGEWDAPRDTGRGAWDAYNENNPFFREWVLFNRYVVNRRIADGFRESLLAGFPPAVIKSHQIPPYAVPATQAFSAEMTRITPVDYTLTAGVGFGFTRYGLWSHLDNYILRSARTSGFDSMIMGEYQALVDDQEPATRQLDYTFMSGASSIHAMMWPEDYDNGYNETMWNAIGELLKNERPRPGKTGGVGQVVPYERDGERYNIAAIGVGEERTGLIKSLNEDGSWQGAVYTVPFRQSIEIEQLQPAWIFAGESRIAVVGPIRTLDGGQQIEITFRARAPEGGALRYSVCHALPGGDGGLDEKRLLAGLDETLRVDGDWKNYRIILRSPLPAHDISIVLDIDGDMEVDRFTAQRHNNLVARIHRDIHTGVRHRGGVTFDVIK